MRSRHVWLAVLVTWLGLGALPSLASVPERFRQGNDAFGSGETERACEGGDVCTEGVCVPNDNGTPRVTL